MNGVAILNKTQINFRSKFQQVTTFTEYIVLEDVEHKFQFNWAAVTKLLWTNEHNNCVKSLDFVETVFNYKSNQLMMKIIEVELFGFRTLLSAVLEN